jgi:hypothetical protein
MGLGRAVTADTVLDMLRQLPPRERLQVIAQALPETERELSKPRRPLRSLRGLCADLGPAPSAEEIDEARREAWANFPREDI